MDFPGGLVFKDLPCNARDAGSSPRLGTKIPQAMGQLRLHAETRQPSSLVKDPKFLKKSPMCYN